MWPALPGSAEAQVVSNVTVTPKYETAGVIVESMEPSLSLEIRKVDGAAFRAAHPFVHFDTNHLASSLFELACATEYEIRVGGVTNLTFTTMSEFSLPAPLRTVNVGNTAQLTAALSSALPGDEILLASNTTYNGMFTVNRSGTVTNPIVIRGALPASELKKAIQDRTGLATIDADAQNHGFIVDGSAAVRRHIVFDSLRVRNARKSGIRLYRSRNCVIQNCQVYDNDTNYLYGAEIDIIGSGANDDTGRHLIQDNHLADLAHPPFQYGGGTTAGVTYYGIHAGNIAGWGTTIRRNLIEHHFDGLSASSDEGALLLPTDRDILDSWENREIDIYDNTVLNSRDDGIETDGICVNQRVFRNYISKAINGISVAPASPGPFFFLRNVVYDFDESCVKFNTGVSGLIRNHYFYHNTFRRIDANTGGYVQNLWDGVASQDIVYRNNIFQGDYRLCNIQPARTHDPDFDYNLWYTPYTVNIFKWESHGNGMFANYWQAVLGEDPNGRWGDPLMSPSLRLADTNSPAMDAGLVIPGINDNHAGDGPDLGAYEAGVPDFAIIAVSTSSNSLVLEWNGLHGPKYTLKTTTNLAFGTWSNDAVHVDIPGHYGTMNINHAGPTASPTFFRLGATPE